MYISIVDVIMNGLIAWINEGITFALQKAVEICGTYVVDFIADNRLPPGVERTFTAFFESFFTVKGMNFIESLQSNVLVPIGMALCLLLMGFGIVRNMFSGLGFAGENPVKMVLRWFIAGVMVFILDDIFVFCLNNIYMPASNMFQQLPTVSAPSMDFNVGFGALTETILLLVFGIMIITNLFKLAIEIVERYLLCNVLIVFSPLLAASITLETTLKVFQSAVKMVVGQSIIMLLNIVTVKLVTLSFNPLLYDLTNNNRELDHVAKIFIDMVFILALLKIAQRFDNYMRDLGLLVGITGGNLWGDIMAAAHTVGGLLSPVTKGLSKGIKGAIAGGSAASAMTGSKMFSAAKAGGIANAGLNAVNSMAPGGLKNARIASDKNGNTLISGTDKNGNSQIFRMSEMKDGAIDKFKNDKNQQAIIGQNGRAYAVENLTGKAASGSASAMAAEAMAERELNSSRAIPLAGGSTTDTHGNVPQRAAASLGALGTIGGVSLANADTFVPNNERIGSGNTSEALKDLESRFGQGSNVVAATGGDTDSLAFRGVDALQGAGMSDENISKLSADDLKNMGAYSETGGELTEDNLQNTLGTARELNAVGVAPENVSSDMIAGYHDMQTNGFAPTNETMAENGEALVGMNKEANVDNMAIMSSINSAGIQTEDITSGMVDGVAEAKANGITLNDDKDIKAAGNLNDEGIPVTLPNISGSRGLSDMNVPTNENTLAGYGAATSAYNNSPSREQVLASTACIENGISPTRSNIERMRKCSDSNGDYSVDSFYASQHDSAIKYCEDSGIDPATYSHAVVVARCNGEAKPSVAQLDAINSAVQEAQTNHSSPLEGARTNFGKYLNGTQQKGEIAQNHIFGKKR